MEAVTKATQPGTFAPKTMYANAPTMVTRAKIFTGREMIPCCSQACIGGPKRGWEYSQP